MRRTLFTTARSALAALALAGLLVGLPVALAALAGLPLPTRLPTLHQMADALSGSSISDATLIKAIAFVCWLAWAQLVVCVLVEVHAWVRGHTAVRLPLGGLLQPLARQLVLTAVMLLPSVRPTAASPMPIRSVAAVGGFIAEGQNSLTTGPGVTTSAVPPEAVPQVPAVPAPTCVVRVRDSLWRLAERHLGSGYRWREIFGLNEGVRQADGRSLRDPDVVRPGWVLTLPPDAVGVSRPVPEAASAPTPKPSVPSAPTQPGPLPAAAEPPVPLAGGVVAAPPAPAASDPAAEGTTPHEPARPGSRGADAPASRASHHRGEIPMAALARMGLMAAGVVVTIDRLRRVQQRHRPRGRTIPVPVGPAAEAEGSLRRAAARSAADRLDVALRSLSAHLAERRSGPVPAIEAVSVGNEAIEILLTEPATVDPGPFAVTAGGRSWTLPADAEVPVTTIERPAPAPLLVLVGEAEERSVLVDLEARPTTALIGEPNQAAGFFAALTLGLATSGWADDIPVVLIGQAPTGIEILERVRVVTVVDEVIEELEAESRAVRAELASSGCSSTFEARLARSPDGWVPTVVLVEDATDPALTRLLRTAHEQRGLAVVVLGAPPVPVTREITLAEHHVRVAPPGLDLTALGVTPAQMDAVVEVIDLAASRQEGEAITAPASEPEPAEHTPSIDPEPTPFAAAARPERPEIEVQVLGSPEIVGGKEPIDRRKSKELVVYLGLHPRGSDESRLKAALWPGEVPSPGTFNQTVSKARVSLGRSDDGGQHLPHVADGLYRLGPRAAVDFHRLDAAFGAATRHATDAVIEELAAALGAARGVPFEGSGAGYEWAHTEGLIARIEAVAADAALLLAEWFLDRRDTTRALWAAAQGLLASPGDERLFRARMRAHDLAGNPAGVESVMEELCHVVEALEPYDELHPETLALYEELRRRGRRTG